MYPVLFSADATTWTSFGIGVLSDTISCEVEENRNGSYELEMTYPITGVHFDDIALRCLILAKPNYTDNPQPFRVYNISKPLNGIVTVSAQHISYDLSGYVDAPFTAADIIIALGKITDSTVVYPSPCPFTFTTDITSATGMSLKFPQSVRAVMGGTEGSFIDTYGGEWHFDGYACELKQARGANRGVVIRYGENLTDLRQEENNANVYTGVYPYYYNKDNDILVTLPEKIVNVSGTFPFTRILPLDLSYAFEETPNQTELRAKAEAYITQNDVGIPKVNLTISFLEADSISERVDLCDTVSVRFDTLGVSASAKCIRTKWDVLKGRYIEAELGSSRKSLTEAIAESADIAKAIDERTSQFQSIATGIISKVTGNQGGYIVLHDTNNDGEPDEILIMDSDDIAQAVNVIRMNNSGIAFSNDGYTGTYITAWNINGQFVADFIAAGELKTDLVTVLGDTQFYWDSSNITIVDPNDSNRIIRFGQYDGVNYGLGFSVDGGTTWKSGFSFDGIKMIGDADNAGYVSMDGDSFDIINANDVSLCHLGIGTVNAEDGTIVQGPYYRLGTYATGASHGEYSFSAGRFSHPTGAHSVCVGYNNTSTGVGSIAIGKNCNSADEAGISIGLEAKATGTHKYTRGGIEYTIGACAIGGYAEGQAYGSISIGFMTIANGIYGIAIGFYTQSGITDVAIGHFATASGYNNVSIGADSVASGAYGCTAVGSYCEATYQYSSAVGYDSKANKEYSCAVGYYAKANGDGSCAIGYEPESSGDWSIAIGDNAKSTGEFATALGPSTTASGKSSYCLGPMAEASGDWSAAFGNHCIASAQFAYAFGNYINAATAGQFVCGAYNAASQSIFVIGNGTSSNSRSNAARVTNAGNMWIAGTLTQGSDARLKNVLGEAPDLSSIRAVRFKWNDNKANHDDLEHIGYVAQDVEKVAPYLVVEDDDTGYKSLNYLELLCAKVEQLERTVERLTKRVAELEGAR